MKTYFDSSGLAKRYIKERGSDKVEEVLSRASEIAISLVGPPEIVSALCRLQRQKAISGVQYAMIKKRLFEDIEDISISNITIPVAERAIGILEEHPLRTMDALHVASALDWQADLFVTADRRQAAAAEASGLNVLLV
jgi:predicted nucleic acid-binding protein